MENRPNILLLVMDACQASALESDSICQTPNFDRLAEAGVRFNRAYCPSPTCSPSRASLMTGLLPHNHGVLEVEHGRDSDQCVLRDSAHWAQLLADGGYSTGYFGKWHVERSNELAAFGWQHSWVKGASHHAKLGAGMEPSAANSRLDPELSRTHTGPPGYNDIVHYGVTDESPSERFPANTVDRALEYLQSRGAGEPWCTAVSFSEPNEALIVCRETFDRYDVDSVPLPETLHDSMADRPNWYQRQQQIAAGLSDDEWRMARTCYYGRITEVDAEFGRLYRHLESQGQLDNTIVIVTSDHGRYVGAHGFEAHNWGPFEEIYRVPMVIAGPGVAKHCDCDSLVGFHDLGPTILERCGFELGELEVEDSVSFAAALEDPKQSPRNSMYAESHGTRFSLTQRILWQGDWKFAFNGFDFDELYHLKDDPHETTNRVNDPDQRERVCEMMNEVWNWIRKTGDKTLLESHYFSMRVGAVGPNL